MAYARMTKITNVCGRSDYITNPERQEKILASDGDVENWKPIAAFEKKNRKNDRANIEARELTIALPNEWANMSPEDLRENVDHLATFAIEKDTEYQYAVHWNKEYTNLHMHVIFSERKFMTSLDVYDRDIYHTEDGKIARSKKDRAVGEDGNYLPPVHRKGEMKETDMSPKDRKYNSREWTAELPEKISSELTRMGYPQREREPYELKQYHQGKGSDSEIIAEKNKGIREANIVLRDFEKENRRAGVGTNMMKLREVFIKALREKGRDGLFIIANTLADKLREYRQRMKEATGQGENIKVEATQAPESRDNVTARPDGRADHEDRPAKEKTTRTSADWKKEIAEKRENAEPRVGLQRAGKNPRAEAAKPPVSRSKSRDDGWDR